MTSATTFTPLQVARRLTELIAALPDADPRALTRAQQVAAVADANGWGEATTAALVGQQIDWLSVYRHLGKTRGWRPKKIHAMPPAALLDVLERSSTIAAATRQQDASSLPS
jgi:hypothetical protein